MASADRYNKIRWLLAGMLLLETVSQICTLIRRPRKSNMSVPTWRNVEGDREIAILPLNAATVPRAKFKHGAAPAGTD
jgi:hypothetical protein